MFAWDTGVCLEESAVNKAESLAILKLTTAQPDLTRQISMVEETKMTLSLLEGIRQTPISNQIPALRALRTRFMNLTFLPVADEEISS